MDLKNFFFNIQRGDPLVQKKVIWPWSNTIWTEKKICINKSLLYMPKYLETNWHFPMLIITQPYFHIIEMMSNPFCNFAFDSNGNTIFATYFHIFTRQYKDAFHLRIWKCHSIHCIARRCKFQKIQSMDDLTMVSVLQQRSSQWSWSCPCQCWPHWCCWWPWPMLGTSPRPSTWSASTRGTRSTQTATGALSGASCPHMVSFLLA